ncbi:MAG: glycosyltransferase family 2 protein [Candidatus Thermoplasmatota archaeon]
MILNIAILMPTLNEEQGLKKTLATIPYTYFQKKNWQLTLYIIDGLSTDNTQQIAKQHNVHVILEPRKGYGRAYKTGLHHLTEDIIITGDADATYPFDCIPQYLDLFLQENLDFMTTNRFAQLTKGSMSVKHRFGNLILAWTVRILFWVHIKDSQSGMWILKKEALSKIQPLEAFNDGMPFSEEIKIEMFTNKKIRAREIPSTLYLREGNVKLESFSDGWKNLLFLFKKRVTMHHVQK